MPEIAVCGLYCAIIYVQHVCWQRYEQDQMVEAVEGKVDVLLRCPALPN